MTRAYVTPDALRWARETSGLTLEDAAQRADVAIEAVAAAEAGEDYLTFRQAERLADAYERPVAALFAPSVPHEDPPEAEFRRLPGAPPPPWPPELRQFIRRVREHQAEAADLLELLDEQPEWRQADIQYRGDPERFAGDVRTWLGVGLDVQRGWHRESDYTIYTPLRGWVDAVEARGILVMQNGAVASEIMRGFAATHPDVPVIVANTNDDPRARAFTVVHELGHLLRARAGRATVPDDEEWCNVFASNLLMPEQAFVNDFTALLQHDLLPAIDKLAEVYGVTPDAAAVRVGRLRIVEYDEIEDVRRRIAERHDKTVRRKGGEYYRNQVARLGPSFIQLVFAALDAQVLAYTEASSYLGVKVNNFGKLRKRLGDRGAR
jgi:Zn-dependent peptidase ImmA (M78 family)/transcriptional regulator with XRE-family HTH domain